MKLLLDTCVWPGAVAELTAKGHDVLWVGDWPAGSITYSTDLRERVLTRAVNERASPALTNGCRARTASSDGLIDVVEFLISATIASADTKRRHPMTTLGRLPARNMA
jgi:hypothetical protein